MVTLMGCQDIYSHPVMTTKHSSSKVTPTATTLTTMGHMPLGEAAHKTFLAQHLFDKAISISRDAHQLFMELNKNTVSNMCANFDAYLWKLIGFNDVSIEFSKRLFKM